MRLHEYNRWRHLLIAEAEGEPSIVDPEELREMYVASAIDFVDGFFEDFELARTFSKE